ncbi:MAG TPA: hypothetical protein PLZ77_04560 [Lachnospiraceae bacterium]|nr:hypothetical protein [Lachnospiraceae bacterium]HPF29362.1 hypothetical protein [Lachnospiraceae bacterium]
MFRMWVKIWKDTRMIENTVICRDEQDTRTHKVFHALEDACHEYNYGIPIWLDKNIREFKESSKTRFYQDNFIDPIEFDYMELHIIEED